VVFLLDCPVGIASHFLSCILSLSNFDIFCLTNSLQLLSLSGVVSASFLKYSLLETGIIHAIYISARKQAVTVPNINLTRIVE